MNLRSLTKQELWTQTGQLIQEEREKTLEVILYLKEIVRRRLFTEYGYSSLWDMLTRKYNVDSDTAQRKVDLIQLLQKHPSTEQKLRDGSLSFTGASLLLVCFRQNKFTPEQEAELLARSENQSCKKIARLIATAAPRPLPRDKETPLDAEHTLLTITIDAETAKLLEQLKAHLSHKAPNVSYGELIKMLAKLGVQKYDKSREPERKRQAPPSMEVTAADERTVRQRAQNRCEYPGCVSTHQTEVDHILPKAMGGSNELDNLRLLCKQHNLLMARMRFGEKKMAQYMRRSPPH